MKRLMYKTVALLGMMTVAGGATSAEEHTLEILAPWEAHGKLYRTAVDEAIFYGDFEGIMYIQEDASGVLDTAEFICPGYNRIDLETQETELAGHCIVKTAGGGVAFAAWTCKGTVGGCSGDFELTGGVGGLEGISGSGRMEMRTALANFLSELGAPALVVEEAEGLAVFSSFTVTLPTQEGP